MGLVLAGIATGLGVVEVGLRRFHPNARAQVVWKSLGIDLVEGVPVWEESTGSGYQKGGRHEQTCVEEHPMRRRILVFGDSVFFGTVLENEEVFSALLENRLNTLEPDPGFCVLNYAQPGFGFAQSLALAHREVTRLRPVLVLWEFWGSDSREYTMLGDNAYDLAGYARRADGFPGIARMPDPVNRWLFLHWRLYTYLTLAYGTREESRHDQFDLSKRIAVSKAQEHVAAIETLTRSVGAQPVLFVATPLDRPFKEVVAAPLLWQEVVVEAAHRRGLPVYRLQDELLDLDYLAIREDDCCHFNVQGHQALARIFEPIVMQQLERAGGSSSRPSSLASSVAPPVPPSATPRPLPGPGGQSAPVGRGARAAERH